MVAIGGKSRKAKAPAQPQVVIQRAAFTNEFALLGTDEKGFAIVTWIGDPNAATKFNSKYEAKARTREMENIPESRVLKVLEHKAKEFA
jgi:hypothetical protein